MGKIKLCPFHFSVMNNLLIECLGKSWMETVETWDFILTFTHSKIFWGYLLCWDISVNKEPYPYGACTLGRET